MLEASFEVPDELRTLSPDDASQAHDGRGHCHFETEQMAAT
ncbi:hypothetical protein [Streptomyces nigra]